jgi:hypothetical protein
MAGEEFKIENRFSSARGLFPYVAGALGLLVLVILVIIVTGVGLRFLGPFGEFFAVHAPTAPDGSEALSLQTLTHMTDETTTLSVEGTVMNRTDETISGLLAVIKVNDKFTLPVQTVNVPVDPPELAPKATGTFRATIMLGENGLGAYSVDFRLPDDGPFVPHKDERPPELLIPEPQQAK